MKFVYFRLECIYISQVKYPDTVCVVINICGRLVQYSVFSAYFFSPISLNLYIIRSCLCNLKAFV